jgi:hypothetical protein
MAAPTAPAASTLPQRWQRVPSSSVLYDVITNTRDEWEAAHPNWRNRHDADEQADARAAFVDTAVHALVPVVPAPFTLDELIAHAHAVATRWNADNPDAIAANAAMPPVISISGAAHRTYASMFLMTVSDIHSWENVLGLSNVTDDYVILAAEAELGSWIDTPAGRAAVDHRRVPLRSHIVPATRGALHRDAHRAALHARLHALRAQRPGLPA